jgi:hypothetical protein
MNDPRLACFISVIYKGFRYGRRLYPDACPISFPWLLHGLLIRSIITHRPLCTSDVCIHARLRSIRMRSTLTQIRRALSLCTSESIGTNMRRGRAAAKCTSLCRPETSCCVSWMCCCVRRNEGVWGVDVKQARCGRGWSKKQALAQVRRPAVTTLLFPSEPETAALGGAHKLLLCTRACQYRCVVAELAFDGTRTET